MIDPHHGSNPLQRLRWRAHPAPRPRWRGFGLGMIAAGLAVAAVAPAAAAPAPRDRPAGAISGPSLLTRQHATFDRSGWGRAGYLGVAPAGAQPSSPAADVARGDWWTAGFQLSGEDLYRINCRACHGVGANGLEAATPGILQRVRDTSAAFRRDVAARQGSAVGQAEARLAAAATQFAILHRLEKGGAVMPAFDHLSPAEVDALLAYLRRIAGVTEEAEPATAVARVNPIDLGEHVVRGVCHTCHDATALLESTGAKPPLAEFTRRYAAGEIVQRLRARATATPTPSLVPAHQPRFDYLHDEELWAAYIYLLAYPPTAAAK